MAEWFKALVLKTGVPARVPWVRIPPLPPLHCSPLFAVVRNQQQKQSLARERCTSVFSMIIALTVACDREFGGRFLEDDMAGKLKPLDIERETKPGKYADGGGLYLIVTGASSKNWSYRYWFGGKERAFKELSLRDARLARDAAKLRVAQREEEDSVNDLERALRGN